MSDPSVDLGVPGDSAGPGASHDSASGRAPGALARRLRIGAAVAAAVLVAAELGLFLLGYPPDRGLTMRFGYPDPETLRELPPDDELFWRQPERLGVNSLGFVGPELELPKPAGRTRFVFLGDSCMEAGYPALLVEQLAGQDVDAANLATAGYTSHQGHILAERWFERLAPDVVVVCFGWNDHWLAWGATDSERARRRAGWPGVLRKLRTVRTVQWMGARLSGSPAQPLDVARVAPVEYRRNLLAIGTRAEAQGARVLLLTAPSSHAAYGVHPALVEAGFAKDPAEVLALHEQYNGIVRSLAAERGWSLLDLAAEAPREPRLVELFTEDGIHFTWRGLAWAAERLSDWWEREGPK